MSSLQIVLLLFIGLQSTAAMTIGSDLDGVHKVMETFNVTGDSCQDCTQIFKLLVDLLSQPDTEKRMIDGLDKLCGLLPGKIGQICRQEVERILPLAVTFLTISIKPQEICRAIGLCHSESDGKQDSELIQAAIQEGLKAAMEVQKGQMSSCSFCIFLIKTLESMLRKERSEAAVIGVLKEICGVLPPSLHDKCETLIETFGKTVIEALLSYATPQAICDLVHLCHGQGTVVHGWDRL